MLAHYHFAVPEYSISSQKEQYMGKYVVKRVLLAIITIFIVCVITFFTMNAIPGGPFAGEKAKSPEVQAALEKRFNLDKPVGQQFVIYMKNLLHGDFGISAKTGREISETIWSKFSVSAKLGVMAVLLAVFLGVVFGSIAALCRNRWPDRLIIFLSTLFTSLPSFVLGSFLLVIFSVKLGLVKAWSPTNQNLILPVIALAMYPSAYITRLTKTSMLDVMGQDYVRTARAKGVAQWKVLFVHTLRNALIPVVTYLGPMIAGVLTGSLVIEQIFTIGGLGAEFVQSITNRDYPMIMGVTIFLAVFMVTMNLLTDIVYKLIDPRINLD